MNECPWHYFLAGFESKYRFSKSPSNLVIERDVPFPAKAFAKILYDKGIKLPVEWENRFSFQQKENSSITNNEIEKQKEATAEAIAPDDMTVVKGLTVGQLRGLLDEKNEGKTFCPVLLAGVRTAIEVADKRKTFSSNLSFSAENSFAKKIAEKRCVELGIFTANSSAKGKEKENPSNQDVDAVARCSRLTRIQSKH